MKPVIGCRISPGNYSWVPVPRDFIWDAVTPEQQKVIVFSDLCVYQVDNYLKVPKKVAWLMESPVVFEGWGHHPAMKKFVIDNLYKFDRVMTDDKRFVQAQISPKIVYQIAAQTVIPPCEIKVYDKSKFCSIVASSNNYHVGHKLRHEIIKKFGGRIIPLGRGYLPFEKQILGYADYMFSIVIENCKVEGHFSEKLLDPIACGTVPIYWGNPSICDLFDSGGIIQFDDIQQLEQILSTLSPEDYWSRLPSIKENLRLLNEYFRIPEYTMWNNVLKELYESV